MLYELLCGITPFESDTKAKTFEKIQQGNILWPDHLSSEARDLLSKLLQRDPRLRIGFSSGTAEIRNHPFFHGINWHLLMKEEFPAPFVPKFSCPTDLRMFRARNFLMDLHAPKKDFSATSGTCLTELQLPDCNSISLNLESCPEANFDNQNFEQEFELPTVEDDFLFVHVDRLLSPRNLRPASASPDSSARSL